MENSALLRQILLEQVEWVGKSVVTTGSPNIPEFRMKLANNKLIKEGHPDLKLLFHYQRFAGFAVSKAHPIKIHKVIRHHHIPSPVAMHVNDFADLVVKNIGEDMFTHEVLHWLNLMGNPTHFIKFRRTGHIPFPKECEFEENAILTPDECATAYKSLLFRRLFLTNHYNILKEHKGMTILAMFLSVHDKNSLTLRDFVRFLRDTLTVMNKLGVPICADFGHLTPIKATDLKHVIKELMRGRKK